MTVGFRNTEVFLHTFMVSGKLLMAIVHCPCMMPDENKSTIAIRLKRNAARFFMDTKLNNFNRKTPISSAGFGLNDNCMTKEEQLF